MELSNPLISEYTWANKPSVAPSGQIICVTDVGENGALFRGNGTRWVNMGSIKYATLIAAASMTGTTSETTLATISVKAGLLGANGKVKVTPLFTMTNNANLKTFRVKYDTDVCYTASISNSIQEAPFVLIRNANNVAIQKTASTLPSGLGNIAASFRTTTVNTDSAFDIVITGQLASSGDTITLEDVLVEII